MSGQTPVQITVNGKGDADVSRRAALQWVMAAVAASGFSSPLSVAAPRDSKGDGFNGTPPSSTAKGYGGDPKLIKDYRPGDLWPLTFTDAQRALATSLADFILPKDHIGPAASELGVIEKLDEWISAPYPTQREDRPVILGGLEWLQAESNKRFGKNFPTLTSQHKTAICDDICYHSAAQPRFKKAAGFFSRFRSICAAAYYSTQEGWAAIGYVGNVPLASFDGPPPQVLEKLGLTQTVK